MAERPETPDGSQPESDVPSSRWQLASHGTEPLRTQQHADRPPLRGHLSDPRHDDPKYSSPLRHHKRTPSALREVKETLNAHVEYAEENDEGSSYYRVNQYMILEEVGRGSYGAVHRGADQFGVEYAIKEFSKARLRRRAQSNLLRQGPRRPPRPRSGRPDNGGPGAIKASEVKDALFLIREEIAIMKKLSHPNLVSLIEVLDDPEEDSLYMVMEMCKKGVVMKVGLEDKADPYPEEHCRLLFRDLILAIEYLHAQGVIHRDIKPDNLLLSDDNILKVVDFGVSEMFEKAENMRTSKSAGSPAFLAPELCGHHGEISGEAADIWSMGVCLYCFKYGRIPFNRDGVLEIYKAIKSDEPRLADAEGSDFVDLMHRILEKDPEKRIKMGELRDHPWVTRNGTDPLLSTEDNCAHIVEPPNELELARAFTRKMNHLICVMRAIQKFKTRLTTIRSKSNSPAASPSLPSGFDPAAEKARAETIESILLQRRQVQQGAGRTSHGDEAREEKSQPVLQTNETTPRQILGIGAGSRDEFASNETTPDVVAESPKAVDFDVYDRAYEDAINEKMKAKKAQRPTLYLTRFVREKAPFRQMENVVEGTDIPAQLRGLTGDSEPGNGSSGGKTQSGGTASKMAAMVDKLKSAAIGSDTSS